RAFVRGLQAGVRGAGLARGLAGEAVGGFDQVMPDTRLAHGVPGIGHDDETRRRPGLVEIPRRPGGATDVVAALNDHAGDVAQAMRVVDQLALGEKSLVREVVVLDARERQRELVVAVLGDDLEIRQQDDRLALPRAPRSGGAQLLLTIVMRESRVIGLDEIVTLPRRDRRQKALP